MNDVNGDEWIETTEVKEVKSSKLLACPCGKIPKTLDISDNGQGAKWAGATGSCCGEWSVEFKTQYYVLDSDDCMRLAVKAWNEAPRASEQGMNHMPRIACEL